MIHISCEKDQETSSSTWNGDSKDLIFHYWKEGLGQKKRGLRNTQARNIWGALGSKDRFVGVQYT